MKRIAVSELSGAALDWAVAKAEGALAPLGNLYFVGKDLFVGVGGDLGEPGEWVVYRPSRDWCQGGPIIERELIQLLPSITKSEQPWHASNPANNYVSHQYGPSPLVAAMRCFVASKLGEEIELPEELS